MSEIKRRTAGRPAGTGKSTSGHSQSLVRGLNLLERLAANPGGLSLSEVAEQSDLAPSTTHRLLQALQSQGFVTQDSELGVWKIDVKTFRIGNSFLEARDFVATSRPFLRRLTTATGETANLGIRDGGTAVFLAQSESPQMMRMITRLGSRAPLHASGVGKALMAWLPEDELARILDEQGLARSPRIPCTRRGACARIWPRSAARASPATGKSTPSACSAWPPASTTSMAHPSPPSRSRGPRRAFPSRDFPNWAPWCATPQPKSPHSWADVSPTPESIDDTSCSLDAS